MRARRVAVRMKHRRRTIIGIITLLLIGLGTYYVAVALFRPPPIIDAASIEHVRRGDVHRSVVATGQIEPRTKVEIKSKASGIVRFVYVKEGDLVKEGQTLLELDRENLEARAKEANAALRAAEASENETRVELTAAQANLERARFEAKVDEYELTFAERDYLRKKDVFSQGLITQSDLEEAEKRLSQARAKRQALMSSIEAAEAEVKRAELSQERIKAVVAQAQAVAERAEEELRNATIRSPLTGVVLSRQVEVGDAVSSILQLGSMATRLMVLGDTSQVFVKGLVNESDIARVRLNQLALLTVESFRDRRFMGTVTRIAPLGTEKDKVINFEVELSFTDGGQSPDSLALSTTSATAQPPPADFLATAGSLSSTYLRPGMSVTAEIMIEERKNVLLIPETTIIYDDQGSAFVEMPDPRADRGKRRVPVQIGIGDGIRAEVMSGLQEGQEILIQ